jgi:hypothetical protein
MCVRGKLNGKDKSCLMDRSSSERQDESCCVQTLFDNPLPLQNLVEIWQKLRFAALPLRRLVAIAGRERATNATSFGHAMNARRTEIVQHSTDVPYSSLLMLHY